MPAKNRKNVYIYIYGLSLFERDVFLPTSIFLGMIWDDYDTTSMVLKFSGLFINRLMGI